MPYLRLIYASSPVDYSVSRLADILSTARALNARDDITGALIARPDLYLQLIEGPPLAVDRAYARIREDARHENVRLMVRRRTGWRLFEDWTMRDSPHKPWMWTPEQIAEGMLYRAPRHAVEAVFVRLWREGLAQPVRRFSLIRRIR